MRRRNPPRRCRRRAGATLIEMLIGLALAAGLLTATAVALDASLQSYKINQEQSGLVQRARMASHRMLSAIRAGKEHMPNTAAAEASFRGGLVVDDAGIRLRTSDGQPVAYRYDAAAKRVLVDENGATHTLLDGVQQFSVRMEPMKSPGHVKAGLDYDLLRRATVVLTIGGPAAAGATPLPGESRDQHTLTISSSAMPRRNAW